MANPEHVEVVRQGTKAIAKWRNENPEVWLDLSDADLRGAANLYHAHLDNAILRGATFDRGVNLGRAHLNNSILRSAIVIHVNFGGDTFLKGTNFAKAHFSNTSFSDVDLGDANGLAEAIHGGPSHVSNTVLSRCGWKIPEGFLRGCGFAPWEVLAAKLYDPSLTPVNVADLQQGIFNERTTGFKVGGMFVSYSRSDIAVVDKLRSRLLDEGLYAWVDVHDATSGPLQKQIHKEIDRSDVVLLILSKNSINSEWVEHEVKRAHTREKECNRKILCPIALDDSWKSKMEDINWEHLGESNILDFSDWEDDQWFDEQFRKMLDGMRLFYGPKGGDTPAA